MPSGFGNDASRRIVPVLASTFRSTNTSVPLCGCTEPSARISSNSASLGTLVGRAGVRSPRVGSGSRLAPLGVEKVLAFRDAEADVHRIDLGNLREQRLLSGPDQRPGMRFRRADEAVVGRDHGRVAELDLRPLCVGLCRGYGRYLRLFLRDGRFVLLHAKPRFFRRAARNARRPDACERARLATCARLA